jgi:aerobic carbon-monoxide dehydrogenase large subunit
MATVEVDRQDEERSGTVLRRDGDALLRGQGVYVDDVRLPGMLHAAVLRSPHAHARILEVDASRANDTPGVRTVLTGAEALDLVQPLAHFFDPSIVGGKTAEFRCLAVDKVRFVGEPVAAAVATSRAAEEAALEEIDVRYDVLPAVVSIDDALDPDAPLLFEDWGDNVLITLPFVEGDAEAALAEAEHTLEGEVSIQRFQTAPVEPRGYVGHWDATGRLTLYASTQNPHPLRTTLAAVLGLPEHRVRVIAPRVGGGFGHKFNGYGEEPLVCVLSKLAGAPVKWIETRAESLLVGAREFVHRFTVGFDGSGRILAIRDRIAGNVGCLSTWGGWSMTYPAGMSFPGPYKVKHYDVESVAVVTNKAPWNGARGYGKESAAVALERMVDLVAEHLSMDPADVRRANFIPADEFPYWTTAKHLDSGNYEGALDKVLALSDYAGLRAEQAEARGAERLLGVGLAFELTPEGGDFAGSFVRGFDTSTVRVSPSGSVTVLTGVTTPGTGNETSIAVVVAREFGIDPDQVAVIQGDTDACPFGFGNFSSRSLTAGGGAAVLAAREVKGRLARAAAAIMGVDPSRLAFADGKIRVEGADNMSQRFEEVAEQVFRRSGALPGLDEPQLEATRTDAPDNFTHVPDEHGRMSAYPSFPYSLHVASVEVDSELGLVRVRAYSIVDDCGVVISRRFVQGQLSGAIAMGVGGALWEELPYDADGQPLVPTLKTYLTPRAPDLPTFRFDSQETPSPYTLLGTKGAGESGVGGAMAALLNGVNDALRPVGARVDALPLSAPNVLRALAAAEAR